MRKLLNLLIPCLLLLSIFLSESKVVSQSVVTTVIFTPPGISDNVGFNTAAAVVNSSGLVYVNGSSAYGTDLGVINPTTDSLISAIPLTASMPNPIVNQSTDPNLWRSSSRKQHCSRRWKIGKPNLQPVAVTLSIRSADYRTTRF